MPDFTPQQIQILERLFAAGFRRVAIPPYESALCIRRDECAAVLTPSANGIALHLLAPPSYVVDGNFSVKIKRGKGEVFVWKKHEVDATPERLSELTKFRGDLAEILEAKSDQ